MNKLLLSTFIMLAVAGCNLGSGNNSSGAPTYTHEQIANYFVADLYYDSAALHNLRIDKLDTRQVGYIVVYDFVTGQQLVVNVGQYDPDNDNAETYYHTAYADAHAVYLSHYDVDSLPVYTDGYNYY